MRMNNPTAIGDKICINCIVNQPNAMPTINTDIPHTNIPIFISYFTRVPLIAVVCACTSICKFANMLLR